MHGPDDPRDAAWWERLRGFAARLGLDEAALPLLGQALTHRGLAAGAGENNERLEYLGDSVLVLLVNEHLYHAHPEAAEGQLSKLKARYVSEPSLAIAAAHLGLGELVALAQPDEAADARARPSLLSDAFEAVLAALYLHRGAEAARDFLRRALLERVDPHEVWDHKSRLQEWVQERHKVTPAYATEIDSGPAHDPVFRSRVAAGDTVLGEGLGRSKKAAEQAAAEAALECLGAAETAAPD